MTEAAQEIFDKAMQLPESARIELAETILDSVAAKSPAEVEAAWNTEIKRRIAERDAGGPAGSTWPEIYARLSSKLSR
jgi:putative addiction module component (TIGR02574 family)